MSESASSNIKQAIAIIRKQNPAPDSWRSVLRILENELGKDGLCAVLNLPLIDLLTNITIADISAMAEGA